MRTATTADGLADLGIGAGDKSPVLRHAPLVSLLAFVAAAALLALRLSMIVNTPGRPDEEFWGLQDFRDAIYYPGVALLDGHNPYDPAVYTRTYPVGNLFPLYLPLTLLVHFPFALFAPQAAQILYFVVSLLMVVVLSRLTLSLCGWTAEGWAASVAAVCGVGTLLLLSRPGSQGVLIGQCATQAVIGVYLALRYARERPWAAGAGIALASIKPTFGPPLMLLMLARGDRGAVLRGLGIAGVLTAATVPFVARAAGGYAPLLASVWRNQQALLADGPSSTAFSLFRVDVVALFGRLLGRPPGLVPETAISVAVLGLVAVALVLLGRSGESRRDLRPLSDTLVCLGVLLCIYHQSYDLVLVAFPTAVAVSGGLWSPRGRPGRLVRWAVAALLVLPAVNYLPTATVEALLQPKGTVWIALASLNGLALFTALLLCTAVALRAAVAAQQKG